MNGLKRLGSVLRVAVFGVAAVTFMIAVCARARR
jgi:hypothetical protein